MYLYLCDCSEQAHQYRCIHIHIKTVFSNLLLTYSICCTTIHTVYAALPIHPLTHSLTHSLTQSLTHSLPHSLTHSLTHSLVSHVFYPAEISLQHTPLLIVRHILGEGPVGDVDHAVSQRLDVSMLHHGWTSGFLCVIESAVGR